MSDVLELVRLALFGITALSIVRFERHKTSRDHSHVWVFGSATVLTILATSLLHGTLSISSATSAALAMVVLPMAARAFYPAGFDRLDTAVPPFVGFVAGATSWGLAWQSTASAAAVTGLFAAVTLVRHDDIESRVPFSSILVAIAFAATTATVLFG